MNVLSLFSGIGGLDIGFHDVFPESRIVTFVEIEPYCQQVLAKRFPDIPIMEDIYDLQGRTFFEEGIEIDWIIGGFPCQAFSHAGRRQGTDDARGVLFWEITRIAGEIREAQGRLPMLFLENVTGLLTLRDEHGQPVFGTILSDLHELGYDTRWGVVGTGGPWPSAGGPHRRQRVWIMAHPRPTS
jgi:DNA (cytosine-5)-methyltransferase 1